jgi:hypothetical protein
VSRGFAVVLGEPGVPAELRTAVADVLARTAGLPPGQARLSVGRARGGLLLDRVPADRARAVAAAVRSLGLRAGVAAADVRERFRRKIRIRSAACVEGGLLVHPDRAGADLHPWHALHLVSVALLRRRERPARTVENRSRYRWFATGWSTATTVLGAVNLAYGFDALLHANREPAAPETYLLDLLFLRPGLTIRIDARRFSYAHLGERKQTRFDLNFHHLVGAIATRAKRATVTEWTRRFLSGDPLRDVPLEDPHDFDAHNRWVLMAAEAFRT